MPDILAGPAGLPTRPPDCKQEGISPLAKIIIPEFMDQAAIDELGADFELHHDTKLWADADELRRLAADAEALIVRNRTQVDGTLLEAASRLKIVARLGVGLDNIDLEACKARNIEVCPAIGANALSVAEYVIAASLILRRGPALRATTDLTGSRWPRESCAAGREIAGSIMGIIGFGSIGQITGERARAMGMKIIACDAALPEGAEAWRTASRVNLDTLLKTADIISLHCPLNEGTRGLIGEKEISQMKPGAIVINSARGGIVDEVALARALRAGALGGAALDTFESEPISHECAALFDGLENVLLSPHIAGVTVDANQRISRFCAKAVRRALA